MLTWKAREKQNIPTKTIFNYNWKPEKMFNFIFIFLSLSLLFVDNFFYYGSDTVAFQYLKEAYKYEGNRLYTRADSDSTRGNSSLFLG